MATKQEQKQKQINAFKEFIKKTELSVNGITRHILLSDQTKFMQQHKIVHAYRGCGSGFLVIDLCGNVLDMYYCDNYGSKYSRETDAKSRFAQSITRIKGKKNKYVKIFCDFSTWTALINKDVNRIFIDDKLTLLDAEKNV